MNLKLNEKFIIRSLDKKIILINKYENREIYMLEDVSKQIIISIINNDPFNIIVSKIKEKYDCKDVDINDDTKNYIFELINLGIVEDKHE